ncbi:hypothetical protein [Escherichia coli]|uniref:hypothetical protein n=1 Tax=Escherichia coli TaxID=562 RepID=UPI000BDF7537|nr:hypothetical protein [Escherichia coli]
MYRVNHIMRTINEMSSYTPHMKVNRISENLKKVQKVSFFISILSFFMLTIISLTYGPFDTKNNLSFISALSIYFINIIVGFTYLLVPAINAVKYIYNLKEEVINELIYDIDSDEQHIEALMPYSLEELTYVSNCIQARPPEIKSKFFFLTGGKTAIISILFLSYYYISLINESNIGGVFVEGGGDKFFVFIMFFILYTSLINVFLKQKILYLTKLKLIIDMAIKIKINFK